MQRIWQCCFNFFSAKRTRSDTDSCLDEALGILKVVASQKPEENAAMKDDCSIFGLHVGNKLRAYPLAIRNMVQHSINTVLYHADIGNAEVQITVPAYQPRSCSSYDHSQWYGFSTNTSHAVSNAATDPLTGNELSQNNSAATADGQDAASHSLPADPNLLSYTHL